MVELLEKCPVCGNRMEKGYVNSGSAGIFWTKEKHKWRVPFNVDVLVGRRNFSWFMASVEAFRCPNDKIVIFSYEKESKSETGMI